MSNYYKVKPGRLPSTFGFFVGIAFTLIGLFFVIPSTKYVSEGFGTNFPRVFGILWTLVAVFITIYHGVNAFSKKVYPW